MILKRITYCLCLFLLALCWIITQRGIFAALLMACLLMALISLTLFLTVAKHIHLRIELPETAAKGTDFNTHIIIEGSKLIDSMHMQLQGRAVNLLCGEVMAFTSHTQQPYKDGTGFALTLNSPYCGRLCLETDRLRMADPLNLFCRTIRLNECAYVMVQPDTFEIDIELNTHSLPSPDSSNYSPDRPGDDPSELFGIRDYREGDAPKSIHWKLSEKLGRTVVREKSLPVSNAIILLLDNCPESDISAKAACCACEALISCSQALSGLGVPHQLAWMNRKTDTIEYRSIASTDDLYGEQGALLSAYMVRSENGILPQLFEQSPLEYSHLLIFAAAQTRCIDVLDGRVTLLLPEFEPENAISCLPERLRQFTV